MKKIINTLKAPKPIGPYSQAVFANNTLYLSGQIGLNPKTMELVEGGIMEETEQIMQNIKSVLEAAEMNFENVVKSSIFLANMNDFSRVNKVYGNYFKNHTAPARETVAVKTLPKNVNLEISMIAIK
ncbi:MAG: reactive intermediate/imine deaminase [Flavobacteriaceae bacterium TMED212]|nr:reactive intermediate/imine deaminase [Paracoccaceae bacterium]OUW76548.1 MAG: reactive intermediate/imine deaminase [Flavobacteriaceae bacterium TMED212]|tara:strand:- start:2216 stop:2596 length:381 start_codon:yes stop_codon:yes gene_type:complete